VKRARPFLIAVVLGAVVLPGAHAFSTSDMAFSISGSLEGSAILRLDRDTPKEDPSTELGIELRGDLASWCSLKVVAQGLNDGTVMDPTSGKLFKEFDTIYQDRNPSINIDEAYVDFYGGSVDVRLGIQKFAWGRLDEINPTDNLNTEDFSQGGTNDESERKIGVPSLKGNVYTDLVNVELAWIPRYVPYRMPTPEERWFPGVFKPPALIDTGTAIGGIPTRTTYRDIDLPPFTLENSQGGIRLMKYVKGWDLSISYYTGYDIMPLSRADVDLVVSLESLLALDYLLRADITLEPRIERMHVYGMDFTTTVGSFTLRGEGAYFRGKYYNRKMDSLLADEVSRQRQEELFRGFLTEFLASGGAASQQTFRFEPDLGLQLDSFKYGLGIDYLHGDTTVSAQCIQEFIPDYDVDKPVYFNKKGLDTLLTFQVKQFFLQNTMEIDLSFAYNIEYRGILVKPNFKYRFTDDLHLTLSALIIDGPYPDSLLGQFKDNDQVAASLKCYF